MRAFRSILGAILALLYALAFGAAYWEYVRADGQWPNAEWLFLVALPYTLAMLKLAGGSVDFSGDSLSNVLTAAAFCCALAYAAGALAEAILRGAWRLARNLSGRA